MTTAGRIEVSVALGCVFAILMISMLLVPNSLLPATVRYSHIREITPSNFLLGLLTGWSLTQPSEAAPLATMIATAREMAAK